MQYKVYNMRRDFGLIELSDCLIPERNENERISNLIHSIETFGVISPIIVEECDLGYKVLNGHRRCEACIALGIREIPAVVLQSGTDSDLIWYENKITQESLSNMKPSEIALIIHVYYERIKSQGFRSDLYNYGEKYDSREFSKKKFQLSGRTISRFLRIYKLCEGLKQFVDRGIVSLRAAVELSYLSNDEQWIVFDLLCANNYGIIGEEKGVAIRRLSSTGDFTVVHAAYILENLKKNENFSVIRQVYKKYSLHSYKPEDLKDLLEGALELYFSVNE